MGVLMEITFIHFHITQDNGFEFLIHYLKVSEEKEDEKGNTYYMVQDHKDDITPHGNLLYKELNYDAFQHGYISLNMPCHMWSTTHESNGVIYVLEQNIEKGKKLLKQALLDDIDDDIKRYENLKTLIQNG